MVMEKRNLNLVESPVVFEPEHHTYHLNGKELSGVTAIVKWLFPDTYAGIPESVLSQAAEYGTLIHSKCELADSMGIVDEPIVEQYQSIIKDAGLQVAVSEYLVSDGENVASSIDKVFTDDSLGDIKTTSKVHLKNVVLQLSIYAYLYELQTGRKVNNLYLIWLPKPQYSAPMIQPLLRIPADVCKYVIEVFAADGDPLSALSVVSQYIPDVEPERKRTKGAVPDAMSAIVEELAMVKQHLDELAEREKELKKQLLTAMQGADEDTWGNDIIQITRKAAYQRESIDTKALKANEPSIYESYKKVTTVAESLTYKLL
jgi:hypothetical protein